MLMKSSTSGRAFRSGVRSGIRSLVSPGSYRSAPVRVRKHVGSFKTDGDARSRDTQAVRRDVSRVEQVVSER